jgi:hypothetical protein
VFETKIKPSGVPPPRRSLKYAKSLNNYRLKKDALIKTEENIEVLENLLMRPRPLILNKLERKALHKICRIGMPDKYRK